MRAPTTILAGLAAACLGLAAAPAAVAEPPWQPATDLFSHMTGQDGGRQLDDAVRDLVTGAIDQSVPDLIAPSVAAAATGDPAAGQDHEPAQGEQQPADTSRWEPAPEPRYTGHPVAAEHGDPQGAPCVRAGGALVEVREHTGGQVHQLGVACIPPQHASPDQRAVLEDLAERRVRGMDLPGGTITAAPAEGLAWLPSQLHLSGTGRAPDALAIGDARLRVAFTPVARTWVFGDGASAHRAGGVTTVEHVYRRAGRYRVTARTVWTALVTLDGAPLTSLAGLTSRTTATYPVGELRVVLTR